MNHPRNYFPSQCHHFSLFTLSQMNRSGRLKQPDAPTQTDNNCSLGVIGFSKLADTRETFLFVQPNGKEYSAGHQTDSTSAQALIVWPQWLFFLLWAKPRKMKIKWDASFVLPFNSGSLTLYILRSVCVVSFFSNTASGGKLWLVN